MVTIFVRKGGEKMAGRKPKPIALRVLEGNPGHRPIPADSPEPELPAECPEPLSYLSRMAKIEWRRVAPELYRLGLLKGLDVQPLAIYCQAYADLRKAQEVLNKDGLTYIHVNKAGEENLTVRPEHYIVQACMKQIKAFCTEFGMTPSSRSRLSLPSEKKDGDGLEDLIQ